MNKDCISCLCTFCSYHSSSSCRYKVSEGYKSCNNRCYVDKGNIRRSPVLVCDKFCHRTVHKFYIPKVRRKSSQKVLETMTVGEFFKLLGGSIDDIKGTGNNRKQ